MEPLGPLEDRNETKAQLCLTFTTELHACACGMGHSMFAPFCSLGHDDDGHCSGTKIANRKLVTVAMA
jgi:CDGSH-type Zn-finger protein